MSKRLHGLNEESSNLRQLHSNLVRFPTTSETSVTFAAYYAQYQVAKNGFNAVDVPELRTLATVCDHLLVRTDGYSFKVLAIIDRDKRRHAEFPFSPTALAQIAAPCVQYTGTVNGRRFPVVVVVMEVGGEGDATAAIKRLSSYNNAVGEGIVHLEAWLIDTDEKRVWTNRQYGSFGPRQAVERLLRAPRLAASELEPRNQRVGEIERIPFATAALVLGLLVIFVLENLHGSKLLQPTPQALWQFGGLLRNSVTAQGEWYRLFTAPLLHLDPIHLAMNCIFLGMMGALLEYLLGWRWLLAVFATGATLGSFVSAQMLGANTVSVGASGGIIALLVATLMLARLRLPYGEPRTLLTVLPVMALIYSFVPVANSYLNHTAVDYGAHIGGLIGGGIAAGAALMLWPDNRNRPRLGNVALVVGAIWMGVAIYGLSLGTLFRF